MNYTNNSGTNCHSTDYLKWQSVLCDGKEGRGGVGKGREGKGPLPATKFALLHSTVLEYMIWQSVNQIT